MDTFIFMPDFVKTTTTEETADVQHSLPVSLPQMQDVDEQSSGKETENGSKTTSVERPVDLYKVCFIFKTLHFFCSTPMSMYVRIVCCKVNSCQQLYAYMPFLCACPAAFMLYMLVFLLIIWVVDELDLGQLTDSPHSTQHAAFHFIA